MDEIENGAIRPREVEELVVESALVWEVEAVRI